MVVLSLPLNFLGGLVQSKINLAILAALVAILGVLTANYQYQKQQELARLKEGECRKELRQVPNPRPIVELGNLADSNYINDTKVGDIIVVYDFPPQQDKWPGAFFDEIAKDSGKGRFSFSVIVQAKDSNSITVTSPCFPSPVKVPFSSVYDTVIAPYQ